MTQTEPTPPDDIDHTRISFTIHEYDLMWPNPHREHYHNNALETVQETIPDDFTDDEAAELVSRIADGIMDIATEDGFSLWVTINNPDSDGAFEYPAYNRSPAGAWNSPRPSFGGSGHPPSGAFYPAINAVFKTETEDGEWGDIPEDIWNGLPGFEKEVITSLRDAFIQTTLSEYGALLIEHAKWVVKNG